MNTDYPMPTENRSSNTDYPDIEAAGAGMAQIRTMLGREQRPDQVAAALEACDWSDSPIGNKAIVLSAIQVLRAIQLPIVGLGPMTDAAEVERLESRIKTQRESIRSHVQEVDRLRVLEIKYGLKIEERNDLLRKCLEWITSARDGVLYPIARDFEGVVGRNAEGLGQETPALIDAIDDALSDSAAPSAPVELDERAAFEKGYHKDALHRDGDEYSRMAVQMAWEGWQARAALERKPS